MAQWMAPGGTMFCESGARAWLLETAFIDAGTVAPPTEISPAGITSSFAAGTPALFTAISISLTGLGIPSRAALGSALTVGMPEDEVLPYDVVRWTIQHTKSALDEPTRPGAPEMLQMTIHGIVRLPNGHLVAPIHWQQAVGFSNWYVGALISTDDGVTWSERSEPWYLMERSAPYSRAVAIGSRILVGSGWPAMGSELHTLDIGVIYSDDEGATWTHAPAVFDYILPPLPLPPFTEGHRNYIVHTFLAVGGSRILCLGDFGTIEYGLDGPYGYAISDNGGATFPTWGDPIIGACATGTYAGANRVFLLTTEASGGTYDGRGRIYRSDDNGATFAEVTTSPDADIFVDIAYLGGTRLALTGGLSIGGTYEGAYWTSDDLGVSWRFLGRGGALRSGLITGHGVVHLGRSGFMYSMFSVNNGTTYPIGSSYLSTADQNLSTVVPVSEPDTWVALAGTGFYPLYHIWRGSPALTTVAGMTTVDAEWEILPFSECLCEFVLVNDEGEGLTMGMQHCADCLAQPFAAVLTADSERKSVRVPVETNVILFLVNDPGARTMLTVQADVIASLVTTGIITSKTDAALYGHYLGWTIKGYDPPFRLETVEMQYAPTRTWDTTP